MSYTVHYPYADNFEDIEILTPREIPEEESEFYEDDYYDEGYMYNVVHILQYKPREEELRLIKEVCPNILVCYSNKLDTHFLAIAGAGMDFGPEIELAYLIADGVSPFESDPYYFDEDRVKLLEELRKDSSNPIEKWGKIKNQG